MIMDREDVCLAGLCYKQLCSVVMVVVVRQIKEQSSALRIFIYNS